MKKDDYDFSGLRPLSVRKDNKEDPNYCEPAYGTKKRNTQIAASIQIEALEARYANLKSFISDEAKELRYEINRLQGTLR